MKKIIILMLSFIIVSIGLAIALPEQITNSTCDLENPCGNGLECFHFPDIGLRCAESNPCSYYECPKGTECVYGETNPGIVWCSSSTSIMNNEFRNAYWQCYDGIESSSGGPTLCKSSDIWKQYAQNFCEGHCNSDHSKCGINTFKLSNECGDTDIKKCPTIISALICNENEKLVSYIDENGCKNYKCVPKYVNCLEIVLYCPEGKLVTVGINDDGCPIQNCVSKTEECNGHKVGERYLATDGCNIRQCTIDGDGMVRESCTEVACLSQCKVNSDCSSGICPDGSTYNKYTCNDGKCAENKFFRDPCGEITNEKECPQLGYREKGKYCNINHVWEEQKDGKEYCDNDFECKSNSYLDSRCTELGFWIKLIEWLSKLFNLKA